RAYHRGCAYRVITRGYPRPCAPSPEHRGTRRARQLGPGGRHPCANPCHPATAGRRAVKTPLLMENDPATIEEATAILLEKMPASKVARLLAALQVGTGDYVKTRDRLFAGETVDSLFEQAKAAE